MTDLPTLTGPLVEGTYYEREDGSIHKAKRGRLRPDLFHVGDSLFHADGSAAGHVSAVIIRQVHIVPTDPVEVVAELRRREKVAFSNREPYENYAEGEESAFAEAAALVAEKLGVKS